jgi:LuxR family maltose regulon positive regulatory protein
VGRRTHSDRFRSLRPATRGASGHGHALCRTGRGAAEYLPPGVRLSRPRLPADVLARPRLLARLKAGLSTPLTLLIAPAGYGKTTLLVQWLATLPLPAAWLSLTPADGELPRFVHELASALGRAVPGACPTCARLLGAPRFPSPDELLALLSDELADLPSEVIVVLDDAHLLAGAQVFALLAGLLEHPPPRLHLVLATRYELPLPLARRRARGQLVELGAADLRLTGEETAAVLVRLLGEEPAREVAPALLERTAGWPALLRLASLSLRESPDRSASLSRLAQVPDRSMSDYLLEDVLTQYAPQAQALLVRLSLLESFNAELAAALVEGETTAEEAQGLLEEWERTDLLIVPLEEQPGWYCLRPLVREVLQQHVQAHHSPQELAGLHRRASSSYAAAGRLDEALDEALAAGESAQAARLVEARFLPAFEREQWGQYERWLRLLPEEQIQQSPTLLFARLWVLQANGKLQDFPRLLEAAERLLASGEGAAREQDGSQIRMQRALIAIARAFFQFFGRGQAHASLESARSALELIEPAEAHLASQAMQLLAWSLQATGQEELALAELQQALRALPARPSVTAPLLLAQEFVYLAAGKLPQLELAARHALRLAREADLVLNQNWAHHFLGMVSYERNDLAAASYHFSAVIANRHLAHLWAVQDALCGLALAYHAQGSHKEVEQTRDELLDWAQEQHNLPQLSVAYAFVARLSLLQDEVEEAGSFLELAGPIEVAGPLLLLEDPPITQVWMLLGRGDAASLAEAQALLDELLRHVEAIHNTRKTIRVLALSAWAEELQDRRPEALATLERALDLGRQAGFVRTFADLPALAPLLHELRRQRKAQRAADKQRTAYLSRILTAMHPVAANTEFTEELLRKEGLEPLTERELDILRLLGREFPNQQIADELAITPGTVKVHTANLYRKLGVESRRAAVTLARTIGLLGADKG